MGSGGDYDPEKLLKKALVSSTAVVKKKPSSGGNLVLKAVADADRSIKAKQREDRVKSDELDAIHAKRKKLSEAMRQGNLDERRIQEINKSLDRKKGEEQEERKRLKRKEEDYKEERRQHRRKEDREKERSSKKTSKREASPRSSSKSEVPSKSRKTVTKLDDKVSLTSKPKKQSSSSSSDKKEKPGAGPAAPLESLDTGDLRHRLGARRKGRSGETAVLSAVLQPAVAPDQKYKGLTVQIENDHHGGAASAESERRRREREEEEEVQRKARIRYEQGKQKQREEDERRERK